MGGAFYVGDASDGRRWLAGDAAAAVSSSRAWRRRPGAQETMKKVTRCPMTRQRGWDRRESQGRPAFAGFEESRQRQWLMAAGQCGRPGGGGGVEVGANERRRGEGLYGSKIPEIA